MMIDSSIVENEGAIASKGRRMQMKLLVWKRLNELSFQAMAVTYISTRAECDMW